MINIATQFSKVQYPFQVVETLCWAFVFTCMMLALYPLAKTGRTTGTIGRYSDHEGDNA